MFSPEDVLLILIVAFLLFGPSKLPEIARSLGKATGEFKKGQLESEHYLKQSNKPLSDKETRIRNLAIEMGINIENKTSEQLIEEIHSKVKSNDDLSVKIIDKNQTA